MLPILFTWPSNEMKATLIRGDSAAMSTLLDARTAQK